MRDCGLFFNCLKGSSLSVMVIAIQGYTIMLEILEADAQNFIQEYDEKNFTE